MIYSNNRGIKSLSNLVEIEYLNGEKETLAFSETNRSNLEWRIDFERPHRPAFKIARIHRFPRSLIVDLPDSKPGANKSLLIRKSTEPEIYDLISKFNFGIYENGRETRYKNVYLVYEALEKAPDYIFVAVRHAISHPKLTKRRAITTVKSLFGSERIDLEKRRHNKIFKMMCTELENRARILLDARIRQLAKNSKQSIGVYTIV
jgi:hypothetical protein